jgi:anthranilate synthase component 1
MEKKDYRRLKFSGGFVGFTGYETYQYVEPKAFPSGANTPNGQKTFAFGYFEDGIYYDNRDGKYYYFTRGRDRRDEYMKVLSKEAQEEEPVITKTRDAMSLEDFTSGFKEIMKNILEGRTFQAVFSRGEENRIKGSMAPLYRRLRRMCPSANMHAIRIGPMESIGSFIELALRIVGKKATTIQVAGTRERTGDPNQDEGIWQGLLNDRKERAEHDMLIDEARNDSARVACPGTVHIPHGCKRYRVDAGNVMHMATKVVFEVNGASPVDTVKHSFPMGTTSGAPKVETVKILGKQEHNEHRGQYAGGFGFLGNNGNTELVVGLRTVYRVGDKLMIRAGAGIVLDSNEKSEFEETENKMKVPRLVVEPFRAKEQQAPVRLRQVAGSQRPPDMRQRRPA